MCIMEMNPESAVFQVRTCVCICLQDCVWRTVLRVCAHVVQSLCLCVCVCRLARLHATHGSRGRHLSPHRTSALHIGPAIQRRVADPCLATLALPPSLHPTPTPIPPQRIFGNPFAYTAFKSTEPWLQVCVVECVCGSVCARGSTCLCLFIHLRAAASLSALVLVLPSRTGRSGIWAAFATHTTPCFDSDSAQPPLPALTLPACDWPLATGIDYPPPRTHAPIHLSTHDALSNPCTGVHCLGHARGAARGGLCRGGHSREHAATQDRGGDQEVK